MKLNFKVFKKGSPLLWIGGAIILFVIFYMFASRGSSSSGSGDVVTYSSGPSDAQLAASTQLSIAQLQANAQANELGAQLQAIREQGATEVALANVGANVAYAQLQSEQSVALSTLTTQRDIAQMQSEYAIESAELAADVQLRTLDTQAAMFSKQLDTNKAMLEIQSQNLISQSLIAQVPSLKKKDRDQALAALAGVAYRGQIPTTGGLVTLT